MSRTFIPAFFSLTLMLLSAALASPPESLNMSRNNDAIQLDLMISKEGLPWVAWIERNKATKIDDVWVKRFDGKNWVQVGDRINTEPEKSGQTPMLRTGPTGDVWMGWTEQRGDGDIFEVKHWNGTAWEYNLDQRQGIDLTNAARSRSLAVEPDGSPTITWSEIIKTGIKLEIKHWNGDIWEVTDSLGFSPKRMASESTLLISPNGKRTVVWTEGNGAVSNLWVKVKQPGKDWVVLGDTPLNIRQNVYITPPSMTLDGAGRPVVAWPEEIKDGLPNIFVKRWDGQKWVALGGSLNVHSERWAQKPSVAVDPRGRIWVAWAEEAEDHHWLYVKVWDGKKWNLLRPFMNLDAEHDAHSPVLKVAPEGQMLLAWIEGPPQKHQVYVTPLN
ncbi:hypothetical protein [Deinococcus cellulosilyticus]|uniref:Uncharacterized protein n=1 Tax=Deinococcus cellulosilyticus (strain DSM 18568 / NBRC 106333 / KACC 11606 / 5516J-15) TaxID=1223518 RepID=A0A511MYJ6_DEIC1|nr:hypothetical protein [Deinococcus cellulosilyticus]GEM45358.1 hypothetical protein DC3_09930 [Deinococcus cellulosilyticus NBRC 106333 = KACC 11606]